MEPSIYAYGLEGDNRELTDDVDWLYDSSEEEGNHGSEAD